MLAVHIHQESCQFLQKTDRHGDTANPAQISAASANFPIQGQHIAFSLKLLLIQHFLCLRIIRNIKSCLHPGLFFARADQIPICPSTQHQIHCVDYDGFAGTCFACHDMETLLKLHVQRRNQRQIMYAQIQDHDSLLSRAITSSFHECGRLPAALPHWNG